MMTDGYSKVAPLQERGRITTADAKSYRSFDQAPAHTETALQENVFHSMLTLERRRGAFRQAVRLDAARRKSGIWFGGGDSGRGGRSHYGHQAGDRPGRLV